MNSSQIDSLRLTLVFPVLKEKSSLLFTKISVLKKSVLFDEKRVTEDGEERDGGLFSEEKTPNGMFMTMFFSRRVTRCRKEEKNRQATMHYTTARMRWEKDGKDIETNINFFKSISERRANSLGIEKQAWSVTAAALFLHK